MTVTAEAWGTRFELAQPAYRRKIKTFARKNFVALPGYEKQDLESEVLEVLWLACGSYDPNRGSAFNNYFWKLTVNRFRDLRKHATRKMRVGDFLNVSLDTYVVVLDDEEMLSSEIAQILSDPSAEDEALARFTAREIYNSRHSNHSGSKSL